MSTKPKPQATAKDPGQALAKFERLPEKTQGTVETQKAGGKNNRAQADRDHQAKPDQGPEEGALIVGAFGGGATDPWQQAKMILEVTSNDPLVAQPDKWPASGVGFTSW